MATSNFFSRSGYYFASDSEDIQLELESLSYDLDSALNLRNFQICNTKHRYSDYLGSMIRSVSLSNFSADILLNVYVNYGYYVGYTIDFDFTYIFASKSGGYFEIDEYPTHQDIEELQLSKEDSDSLLNWLTITEESLKNEFISYIRTYDLQELKVLGRFSNGETIYESVAK